MADTGEKIYIAKEETSQEILTEVTETKQLIVEAESELSEI